MHLRILNGDKFLNFVLIDLLHLHRSGHHLLNGRLTIMALNILQNTESGLQVLLARFTDLGNDFLRSRIVTIAGKLIQ
ncbi:Uncharacterised protein [Salmonella enterica subsp. enterica serovar Bovismorbificans]|uniref:Uncharacterized protein n=1 Tax=Salmonella enterica subsp. enterica serovar Bovismorbificans TaxID=58097 RepID=A0A655BYV9_SALET|nr:Uncharacterised protein [Salmonella enterica subsp. enterica serovar Bovismorbificans]CQB61644.1 Uncharacterised protein [Salmonella enterica subsp. enterica serovar Bovismorbificans]